MITIRVNAALTVCWVYVHSLVYSLWQRPLEASPSITIPRFTGCEAQRGRTCPILQSVRGFQAPIKLSLVRRRGLGEVPSVKPRSGQRLFTIVLSQGSRAQGGKFYQGWGGPGPPGPIRGRPSAWREKRLRGRLQEARGQGQGPGTGKRVLVTTYLGLGAWDPEGTPALEPGPPGQPRRWGWEGVCPREGLSRAQGWRKQA